LVNLLKRRGRGGYGSPPNHCSGINCLRMLSAYPTFSWSTPYITCHNSLLHVIIRAFLTAFHLFSLNIGNKTTFCFPIKKYSTAASLHFSLSYTSPNTETHPTRGVEPTNVVAAGEWRMGDEPETKNTK